MITLNAKIVMDYAELKNELVSQIGQSVTKFESQKTDFFEAIAKNMKVVDNLVQEYAIKTKE